MFNLIKSEFAHGTVMYLGQVVGQGMVKPVDQEHTKDKGVCSFSKKQLMH